jgi:hypothetical protein
MGVSIGGPIINFGKNPIKYEYTASSTWYKPSDSTFYGIYVLAMGAGGGGGSGRRGLNTSNRNGGSGGGGGARVLCFIPAASLSATHSITIGSGGSGGLAQTSDSTNGNIGTDGGDVIFENYVTADGGGYGRGGTQGNSSVASPFGGQVSLCIPYDTINAIKGGYGGGLSSIGNTTIPQNALNWNLTPGPIGGAGGGAPPRMSTTSTGSSSAGGGISFNGTITTGGTAGPGQTNGGDGQNYTTLATGLFFGMLSESITIPLGTGGGGGGSGDQAGTVSAGRGGNGGNCAGGGGGGPASNGANSGAGGSGGNGVCVVVEIYGA